jgi:Domain of unknown function (DUF4349)
MSAIDVQALLLAHAPQAPEALRARVAELVPTPRPRSPRRLLFVVVPAAVALAVAAAIVHGIVHSGSKAVQHGSVDQALTRAAGPAAAGSGSTPSPTWGAVNALAPNVGGGGSRLQHTEASLQVRVPDVARLSDVTTAATRIATSLGGYAQSVVYRTPEGGGGASFIELRVPAQNVRLAVSKLAALGTLVSQQLSVQDLQHDFEVESAQIAQHRRAIAALEAALRNPALPDAQRVLLQIKLAEEKRALSQRTHARKGTISAGTTARISLVLSTKKSMVPVTHHRGRLGRMVHGAVGFLGLEGTIVLYALIVLSPIAFVAALLWGLREARRRRDERLVME